jgi:hypothetical protein
MASCVWLLISGAAVYRLTYPPLPENPQALLGVVDNQVADLRELEFQQPVSLTLITSSELQAKLETDFAENWSPAEAREDALTLVAFDLLDPGVDLYQLYLDTYGEQIAGYYDPEVKTFYIISDQQTVGPAQRITMAHELTHALQDQHFGLEELETEDDGEEQDSEAAFAFDALAEGDASLLEQQYTLRRVAPHEFVALFQEFQEMDLAEPDQTPFVIMEGLLFPYREGLTFATALYDQGGWPAVDAAYANPPVSTEHILHPERYQAGDIPQMVSVPPLTDTLGHGWRQIDEDVLGEFYMRLHLQMQLTPTLAIQAAEGWGGDRYAVYHHEDDDNLVVLLHNVWDTPAEAEQFFEAYSLYLEKVANLPANFPPADRYCWPLSDDYRCVWRADKQTTWVIRAPTAALTEKIFITIGE